VIHVAELVGRVTLTRRPGEPRTLTGDAGPRPLFPLERAERVVPAPAPEAPAPRPAGASPGAPDPRLIADLVYRLMRDDLALSRERA
jgi:hypothetical protein